MRYLWQTHKYLGITIAAFFLTSALSGTVLVFMPELERIGHPRMNEPLIPTTAKRISDLMDHVFESYSDRHPQYIEFPKNGRSVFVVALAQDQHLFLAQDDFSVVREMNGSRNFLFLLRRLHVTWFAGRTGQLFIGFVGLSTMSLAALGLIMWWPGRKRFSPKDLLPKSIERNDLRRTHRALGSVLGPFLIVFTFIACSIIFHFPMEDLFELFDDPNPVITAGASDPPVDFEMAPWDQVGENILAAVPGGIISSIILPNRNNGTMRVFMRFEESWKIEGASNVYLSAKTGEVLVVDTEKDNGYGERLYDSLFPIHSGHGLSLIYRIILVLFGIGIIMIATTSALSFTLRRKKR